MTEFDDDWEDNYSYDDEGLVLENERTLELTLESLEDADNTGKSVKHAKSRLSRVIPIRFTQDERELAIEYHKSELKIALKLCKKTISVITNECISMLIISILPQSLNCQGKLASKIEYLKALMAWFRSTFAISKPTKRSIEIKDTIEFESNKELISMQRVIEDRRGSPRQLNHLFICLLNSLGHFSNCVRYVRTVDPAPPRPEFVVDILATKQFKVKDDENQKVYNSTIEGVDSMEQNPDGFENTHFKKAAKKASKKSFETAEVQSWAEVSLVYFLPLSYISMYTNMCYYYHLYPQRST